jgi:hypothetical protein
MMPDWTVFAFSFLIISVSSSTERTLFSTKEIRRKEVGVRRGRRGRTGSTSTTPSATPTQTSMTSSRPVVQFALVPHPSALNTNPPTLLLLGPSHPLSPPRSSRHPLTSTRMKFSLHVPFVLHLPPSPPLASSLTHARAQVLCVCSRARARACVRA